MSFVLGLTGQTGAGKTTVADVLRREGIPVIDADQVARTVVEPGCPALSRLVEVFGPHILQDGRLNRKKLGQLVFSDKEELLKLNAIMYPYICQEIEKQIGAFSRQGESVVVLDAPTLFESGADGLCNEICGVIAPVETRCRRIMERDNLSTEEAMNRIQSQHKDDYFYQHCHMVIKNVGSISQLREEAYTLAERLKGKKQ